MPLGAVHEALDDLERLSGLLDGLRCRGHTVKINLLCAETSGRHYASLLAPVSHQCEWRPLSTLATRRPGTTPLTFGAFLTEARDAVSGVGGDADVVIVEGLHCAGLLDGIADTAIRAVDTRAAASIRQFFDLPLDAATARSGCNLPPARLPDLVICCGPDERRRLETAVTAPVIVVGCWPTATRERCDPRREIDLGLSNGNRPVHLLTPRDAEDWTAAFHHTLTRATAREMVPGNVHGFAAAPRSTISIDAAPAGLAARLVVVPTSEPSLPRPAVLHALADGSVLIATSAALCDFPVQDPWHCCEGHDDLVDAAARCVRQAETWEEATRATETLAKRHQEDVQQQLGIFASVSALRAAARRVSAVVVTDVPFWHARLGHHQRICEILSTLRSSADIHVVIIAYREEVPADLQRWIGARGSFSIFRLATEFNRNDVILPTNPVRLQDMTGRSLSDHVADTVGALGAKLLIAEYIWAAAALRSLPKGVLTAIDLCDVMYTRSATFERFLRPHHIKVTAIDELPILARFDALLTIQGEDHAHLESLFPGRSLLVTHVAEAAVRRTRTRRPLRVGFLGGDSVMNADGVNWFIRQVWPVFHGSSAEFHIAGGICDTIDNSHTELVRHGAVEETSDFLREIDIAVNPVYYGGGLKVKTVEYLAHGLPSVVTAEAVRGMAGARPFPWMLARSRAEFVGALHVLLASDALRSGLSARAFRYARRWHGRRAQRGALELLVRLSDTVPR